ncbi:MAG: hypothetical protein ACLRXQ_13740 [Phascolarctobacterium faecium]
MEFFIFLCFMSFVSFAVAFLAYGLVIRLMGTTSSASRYSQIILVPIAIIGYDFLTITAPIPLCYRRPADAAFTLMCCITVLVKAAVWMMPGTVRDQK